jgi:hypothetical protein
VRIYVLSSASHRYPTDYVPRKSHTQNLTNPLSHGEILRALMVAMDRWVCAGAPPPPSRYPKVKEKTLVPPDQKSTGFPAIPGVRYSALYNRQLFLDYGPDLLRGKISVHPPRQIKNGEYKNLVTKVDKDGNDVAGIRLPTVQAPVATYTGWNLWAKGFAEDELCGLFGSYIPFAMTKAEREKSGDPRLSIEERYKDHADYVRKVSHAARALVDAGYVLPEDAERIVERAKKVSPFTEESD